MTPDEVWAIGIVRDPRDGYRTPITTTDESGNEIGLAPLTILDADGERAMPVYSTRGKAERAIDRFMQEDMKAHHVGAALLPFETLVETMSQEVAGATKPAYIGVDMLGAGQGQYPLIRL
jgi:ketopantoate hydroxymethyltransferase